MLYARELIAYIAAMSGRFTRMYRWAEIQRLYMLTSTPSNVQPRFNICPTTTVDVVIFGEGKRSLVPMRWGLIPGWWKRVLDAPCFRQGMPDRLSKWLRTNSR